MESKKLTPEQKRQMILLARNLKAMRELKERNRAIKARQEVTEQKMKSIADWQKSPISSEQMDKILDEHFEDHTQVNPNKMNCKK